MRQVEAWIEQWLAADGGPALVFLTGVGLLLLAAGLLALLILGRRHRAQEARQLVLAVEELRSGRLHNRAELGSSSPLGVVSDAVERLGRDMAQRWRESEGAGQQLSAVMDAASDIGVLSTDTEGDVTTIGAGFTEIFGWEEEQIVGRAVSLLFDADSWKEFLPKLARKSLRERGIDTRATLLRQDGTTFEAQLAVRALRGPSREISGFLVTVQDISARARLEQELRASEERYRSLVEGLSEGAFIVRKGRLVYVNPALAELCGVPASEMQGSPWRDYVSAKDVLLAQELVTDLEHRADGRADQHLTLLGADGRPRADVHLRAASVEYAGHPAVLGMVLDETAERRIDAELRQNETQLDAVLEATSDGILVLAETVEGGVVHLTNEAFLEMFDLAGHDVLGVSERQLARLLAERGEGAEAVAAELESPASEPRSCTVTLDGPEPREVEVMTAALIDRTGAPLGKILACRDLSEQRESERELRAHAEDLERRRQALEESYAELSRQNEDLARKGEELGRLNRELRTLDEMKSNLLGNVSHELQTPLVSIRGFTEMILKGRLGVITEEQRKGLQISLKNIDRLISMIDNLLAFSRMSEEAGRLRLSTFGLRAVVQESRELQQEQMDARQIRFSSAYESPEVAIRGDRDMILQVFINLLSNAIKFNREGGRIEVTVRAGRPGFVMVQVQDTGIGIPQEDLERIFERSYRSRQAGAAAGEGSGLGLSIVRNILRLHGCTIQAESRAGRGSVLSLNLPLAGRKSGKPEGSGEGAEAAEGASEPPSDTADSGAPGPERLRPETAATDPPDASRSRRRRLRIIRPANDK